MDHLYFTRLYFFRAILIPLMALTASLKAQDSKIESLASQGYSYRFTDSAKAKQMLNNALILAKKSNSKKDEAICLAFLALTYRRLNSPKEFNNYAEQAYKISSQTNDERAKAYTYMVMGNLKSYFDDNAAALNYQLQANTLFEKHKNYALCAQICADISYSFSLNSDDRVEKYVREAMKHAQQSSDAESILHARLAMGSYLTGLTDKDPDNISLWENSVKFLKQTADYSAENDSRIPSKSNIAISHLNLAALLIRRPKLMDGMLFARQLDTAIAISKKYGVKATYRNSLGLRGKYLLYQGNYSKAKKLFLDGIAYQLRLPYKDHEILSQFYASLKEVAAREKDYSSYYLYDQSFSKYNRLTYDEAMQRNLQLAEIKFESAEKIRKIKQLENEKLLQEKNKNLGYVISLILFLIVIFIFISFYYRKRFYQKQADNLKQQQINDQLKLNLLEKDSLENLLAKLSLERRFLQSQMDPHFIFNCLANIQSIILKGDRTKALTYLNKFARLTRETLYHSRKESVTLEEETENLKSYIELQQLRLNHSFDYRFEFSDEVNMYEKIPPLLIQPLVENAIEHGLKPLTHRKGNMVITFTKKSSEQVLICVIRDNGIGMEASQKGKNKDKHDPLAIKIIDERLALYAKNDSDKLIPHFTKQSSDEGCTITINIPIV
ncbi:MULTISPECIES: sensor histidine kinase [unclassified Sphingobacterium]|uniref:sensor histidine kinase n=1 Tax=unclassified Sphingobacterium TaxID=2609468 RepID=UPI0025D2105D|nr:MULTISPECIES: histidine kinase [unclassified Sphingobacterium]